MQQKDKRIEMQERAPQQKQLTEEHKMLPELSNETRGGNQGEIRDKTKQDY